MNNCVSLEQSSFVPQTEQSVLFTGFRGLDYSLEHPGLVSSYKFNFHPEAAGHFSAVKNVQRPFQFPSRYTRKLWTVFFVSTCGLVHIKRRDGWTINIDRTFPRPDMPPSKAVQRSYSAGRLCFCWIAVGRPMSIHYRLR